MHEFVIKFINNNININILYDKDNEIDNGNPPGMARYLLRGEYIRCVLCRLKLNLSAVNAASLNSITLTDCKKSAVFVTRYSHCLLRTTEFTVLWVLQTSAPGNRCF